MDLFEWESSGDSPCSLITTTFPRSFVRFLVEQCPAFYSYTHQHHPLGYQCLYRPLLDHSLTRLLTRSCVWSEPMIASASKATSPGETLSPQTDLHSPLKYKTRASSRTSKIVPVTISDIPTPRPRVSSAQAFCRQKHRLRGQRMWLNMLGRCRSHTGTRSVHTFGEARGDPNGAKRPW